MKRKVLIVDDNSTNLYMLETLLKGYGFEVTSAENGKDALDKAILNPPDLIVTDILMPVMDGYALCRRWKSDDTLKHIPLVFYTATYTGSKNEDFALSLGAERFIIKPQEPDKLMNILKEVLGKKYVVKQVATKPLEEEMEVFRQYNEILFGKLEKKMADLEIANQELRMLEERYRLSFENITDVVYTVDMDLNITSISPSVEKILGYKPQDFIGRPVSDLGNVLTPESFEQAVADISLILKGVTIHAAIYQFIAKDGTIKIVEVSGSPLICEGKIIGIISVARDVTDRIRVEEALRSLTSRQKAILAAVPEIIMEVDNNKVYTWANSAGIEFFGEDVIGKEAAFYFEDEQETYDTVKPLFCGAEDVIYVESWQRRKDGEKRVLAWWCRVLKDESGQVTGALSSARDITESKLQERALRESEKKYHDLFNFLPIPVYEMDFEANITSANRAIYESFRGTEEDLKRGFKGWQLLSPEEIEKSAKNIERLLKGEQIGGNEYNLRRLDGSVFPAIVISSVIYSDDKPVGLRGAIIDMTQIKRAEDDIKLLLKSAEEERNKLSILIESMTDEVWFADTQKIFTLANPSAIKHFCLDPDQEVDVEKLAKGLVVLRPDGSVRPVEEAPPLRALSGEVVINQEEIVQIPASGEFRYRQVNAAPVRYADGKIIGAVSVVRDITDSKRADDELRRTSSFLNLIVENIPDMIFLKDAKELRFIRFNQAGEVLLGYSRDELLGKNDYDFFPKEQADFFIEKDREVLRGTVLVEIPEEPVQTRNKGERTLHTKKVPILNAKGEPEYLLGISEDITERKQVEEALVRSEEKYRGILENIDDAYYELDLSGNFVFFNDALISKTGYSREELMGMNYKQYISPETVKPVTMIFSEIYRTGQLVTLFDYEVITKDGQIKYFESWAGLLRNSKSQPIGFKGMARDITARKAVEKQLQETLKSLTKAINTTIQVMVSAVEVRDPYTAGHQIRSTDLASAIATEMGLLQDKIEAIRMAGPIHDIGKLSVPAEILSKPTKLKNIEFSLIKEHARVGFEVLKDVESPWPLAEIVYQHHERMDGSGYPRQLKGDEILIEARILAVADVVESMSSHRPYRPALGLDAALEEIENNKGTLYDADVVDACLILFRVKGFQF
jgi:PAS domain S-box-containing protein